MTKRRLALPSGIHRSHFHPAWWLANPHLQTVWAPLFRRLPDLKRQRKSMSLSDGDNLLLDYCWPAQCQAVPLTLLVHGLAGSSESGYVLGLQHALAQKGWPSVAVNCRGAAQPNLLPRSYHAGSSDDLQEVVLWLAKEHPDRTLMLVGFSLGGNMTLKLLGEWGEPSPLVAAVAVSVPFRLGHCANRLDQGGSRLYRRYLLQELVLQWERRIQAGHDGGLAEDHWPMPLEKLRRLHSFWEFDDQWMAPIHGFSDVHDYYRRCSSIAFLPAIRTPTLIIQSEDDPFMEAGVLPEGVDLPEAVHLELAKGGGHVGFIAAQSLGRPHYYLEWRIPNFLQQQWDRLDS